MQHGSSATWLQTGCCLPHRTRFINYFNVFEVNFVVFYILCLLEFGAIELNSTFGATAVLLPFYCRVKLILSSARQ